jgi:biopolymer transport protein ExbD
MHRTFRTPATPEPMWQINTTPMIDVMLVLLVMMILSLPMQTHKVAVDLPQGKSLGPPPVTHRLTLDAGGGVAWDGVAVSDAEMRARLAAHASDPARPALVMQTDAATPYARFDAVIAQVRQSGVDRLGFAGNEAFRAF